MDPNSPEFAKKYPCQLQEYAPYRGWREVEGHNFSGMTEAMNVGRYLLNHRGWKKRLRVWHRASDTFTRVTKR